MPSRYEGSSASITDSTERQLHLLSWWYERFHKELPEGSIIRYEGIVSSGGGALSAVTVAAETLQEPLSSQSPNALYDRKEMRELGGRLLDGEGAYWRFYTRKSVEGLIEEAG